MKITGPGLVFLPASRIGLWTGKKSYLVFYSIRLSEFGEAAYYESNI